MKSIRTREQCPICQKQLEIYHNEENKKIVVKACPTGHYRKEIHPLLEGTFEYYTPKENERRNRS